MSEIVLAELVYGAVHSNSVERHLREVEMLKEKFKVFSVKIEDIIEDFAVIKHFLVSHGTPVGDFDILIGATARHYGLTVVTDNVKHFAHTPGVKVEDWTVREGSH